MEIVEEVQIIIIGGKDDGWLGGPQVVFCGL